MRKKVIWLSIIPSIGSLTIINRVEPYVFGMPFVMFWSVLWVVLTACTLLLMYKIDPANKGGEEE